jgi:hypothetical protein
MPWCCSAHGDWRTLCAHLAEQFPTVETVLVSEELDRAQHACIRFGLQQEEHLPTSEILARHNLMLLTEHIPDSCRLDPERHVGREGSCRTEN